MKTISFSFDERLDTEFLYSIYEGDAEHASVVFEQFLQLAPALVNEIDKSYGTGIIENFRENIHKLKPVFSFVGLTQLTAEAEKLEKKCRETFNISNVRDEYITLKNNYLQNYPIIENELIRLKEQMNSTV